MEKPFYSDGLNFECQKCSGCCRHDPGYVFLSQEDLDNLSRVTSLSEKDFKDQYCREINIGGFRRLSLNEKSNYDCIFWKETGCIVYEGRPLQCRSYPFWTPYLYSKSSWDELESSCPGVNKGRIHSFKEIEGWLNKRVNTPFIFPDTKK